MGTGYVTLRSVATGEAVATFKPAFGFDVAFSPDGTKLAAGNVRMWDVRTGEELGAFEGHEAQVMCIRFSPDGKTLATSSVDHTIKLWDIEAGQVVATLRGHRAPVSDLAFSHDGTILASSGMDKTVRLWRADSTAENW